MKLSTKPKKKSKKLNLKVDSVPKVQSLAFFSANPMYGETASPRSLVRQSGLEFDHFRVYTPGEDATHIDWKASARSQDLLVRVYSENISINVIILLDVSESMIYGVHKKAKIEYAIEMALNMAHGILGYGDACGLLMFNDGIVQSIPVKTGVEHFMEIRGALLNHDNLGGGFDLPRAINFINENYLNTHLILLVSDFLGGQDTIKRSVMNMSTGSADFIGVMVYDKSDMTLDGIGTPYITIKDPYSNRHRTVKVDEVAKRYEAYNKKRVEGMQEVFQSIDKDLWMIRTDEDVEKRLIYNVSRTNSARQ